LHAASAVIERQVRAASMDEAETLGLAPGAPIFELERLRSMDDMPILLDRSRIPLALAPELEDVDFSKHSLYAVLEERYAIRPARAHFSIEAVPAGAREAKLLGVDPGAPLLRCDQVTEDDGGRLIELCQMRYRGDRYRFRGTLVRPSPVELEHAEASPLPGPPQAS